ncbi:MAG: rhomboid family intramembrane serine protease [Kiloniellales bacterium]|nr:rhomboid family intramembrane serine protease [Kiloniellales bacterium]
MPFLPLHDDHPRVLIQQPWVTWALIAVCSLVFLHQASLTPSEGLALILGLGLIPATVTGEAQLEPELALVPPWATLVTAAFLHGGWMHLIANMLYLWVFGDNVEDAMGHWRFLAFYLLCGLAAGLAHIAADPGSTIPTVGASGAISGVLGASLILHPKSRVLVPVIVIPLYLPAWALLVFWIGFQVWSATVGGPVGGGIAWWEHIGGFVAGALLVVPFRHRAVPLFGGGALPQGVRLRPRRRNAEKDRPDKGPEKGPEKGPWA